MVNVEAKMSNVIDWSIIGLDREQIMPTPDLPWGPMPSSWASSGELEMQKALTAPAANYGCPMLWADGITPDAPLVEEFRGELNFTDEDLEGRYRELSPKEGGFGRDRLPAGQRREARETAAAIGRGWSSERRYLITDSGSS